MDEGKKRKAAIAVAAAAACCLEVYAELITLQKRESFNIYAGWLISDINFILKC